MQITTIRDGKCAGDVSRKGVNMIKVTAYSEYCLICKSSHDEFEKEVTAKMRQGWKLVGGVYIVVVGCLTYYQAMKKQIG